MKAGNRILADFFERMLGEGDMGTVYHARHTVSSSWLRYKSNRFLSRKVFN